MNNRKAAVISTGVNIFSKGIAFFNTLVISFFFGVQNATDVYFTVIGLTALFCTFVNNLDYFIIIPEAIRLRQQKDESQSRAFVNSFFSIYLVIGAIFTLIIFLNPVFIFQNFSKIPQENLSSHKLLLLAAGPIVFLQLINGLLSATLSSYRFFILSSITSLANGLCAIFLTIALHHDLGINITILGIVIGYMVSNSILIYVLKSKLNWKFSEISFQGHKRIWKSIFYIQMNVLPVFIRSYVVVYFMSGMGESLITCLTYAQNIVIIPEAFVLSQLFNVLGIRLSEFAAKQDIARTKDMNYRIISILFTLMIPITAVLMICNTDIVKVLFFRGNFSMENAQLVSYCLFYLALLLPTRIPDILFVKLFSSYMLHRYSSVLLSFCHILITLGVIVGIRYYGLYGYFIAILLGYYFLMPLTGLLILKKKLPQLLDIRIAKFLLACLIAIAACIPVLYLLNKNIVIDNSAIHILLQTAVTFVLFISMLILLRQKTELYNHVRWVFNRQIHEQKAD